MSEAMTDLSKQNHHEITLMDESNEVKSSEIVEVSALKHLNFIDLINKADIQKDIVDEAGLYFSQFSNQSIKIYGRRCAIGIFRSTHKIKSDCIEVYDLDLCSKIMRNFGKFITSLSIDFDGLRPFERFNSLIQYEIIEYCTNSLVKLEMQNCKEFLLHKSKEIFPGVRSVSLKGCDLENKIIDWNLLFPNLNRLELLANIITNRISIEQNIPSLNHLAVGLNDKGFSHENLLTALCFNEQLTSLHLVSEIDSNMLRSITEVAPFLKSIHLQMTLYSSDGDEMVKFRNVDKFILTVNSGEFEKISIWFDHLKEMELMINDGIGDGFIDFITQNEKLTKLTIVAPSWNPIQFFDNELMTIASKLTCLNELTLNRCIVSTVGAIMFMNNSKMLKDFRFSTMNKDEDKPRLVSEISNEWTFTEDDVLFKCERQ